MEFKSKDQYLSKMKSLAKKNNVSPQDMYKRFLLEEFAQKIGASKYNDSIVLKGGFVVATLLGIENRITEDLDFTVTSKSFTLEEAKDIITDIANTQTDSLFHYSIKNIRDEQKNRKNPGYRIMLDAEDTKGFNLKFHLKLDVASNTVICPNCVSGNLKSIIDDKPINVLIYPVENILAEKYEITLDRGPFNTRMRDLTDIYLLYNNSRLMIDKQMLIKEIINISNERNTTDNLFNFEEITNELISSDAFSSCFTTHMEKKYPDMQIDLHDVFDTFKEINHLVMKELKSSSDNRKKTLD